MTGVTVSPTSAPSLWVLPALTKKARPPTSCCCTMASLIRPEEQRDRVFHPRRRLAPGTDLVIHRALRGELGVEAADGFGWLTSSVVVGVSNEVETLM